jgi:hypothetical protein
VPDVYDMHVGLRWAAKSGTPWDGEIALWGFRIRPNALGQSWPAHGTLTPTPVDLLTELEDDTYQTIEWQHAANQATSTGFTQNTMKAVANSVRACAIQIAPSISSTYELVEIRMQAREVTGKSPGGSNKFFLKTPIAGTASGSFTPNQAVVLTHQSFAPGRKGKGRTYIGPVGSAVLTTAGLISGSSQTALMQPWTDMLQDIKDGGNVTPTNVSFPSFDFWDIQQVECGDEMDVQNRRRKQRPENYAVSPIG